ncbi:hypothetical protein KC799_14535 [candidate division KSB1 bacterium]|nr:hypothetical protein [candidate division KSB1 bacterium]
MTTRTILLLIFLLYLSGQAVSAANDEWTSIPPQHIGASATSGLYVYVKKGTAEQDTFRVLDTFNRSYIGDNWAFESQYWTIEDYELVTTEAAWRAWKYLAIFKPVATDKNRRIYRVGHTWGDSATYVGIKEGAMAVMATKASTTANAYWLWHRSNYRQIWLWEIINGIYDSADGEERKIEQVTAKALGPVAGDKIYTTISEEPNENVFRYYVNGRYDGTVRDPEKRFSTGKPWYVGLFMRGEDVANDVDDFEVYFVGPSYDTSPPAQVTDLFANEAEDNSLTLHWTASGDNGFEGTPAAIDFRYSLSPITLENFNDALQPETLPDLLSGRSTVSLRIDYLIADTTYYFAIKYTDQWDNESQLSTPFAVKTAALIQPVEILTLSPLMPTGTVHQKLPQPVEFRIMDSNASPVMNARVRIISSQTEPAVKSILLQEAESAHFSFPFFKLTDGSAGHAQHLGVHDSEISANELRYHFQTNTNEAQNIWLRFKQKNAVDESIALLVNGQSLPAWALKKSANLTGDWHWSRIGTVTDLVSESGDTLYPVSVFLQNISTNILLDQIQLLPENEAPVDGIAHMPEEELSDQTGFVSFQPVLPTQAGFHEFIVQTYDSNIQSSVTIEALADTPDSLVLLSGSDQAAYPGDTLAAPFAIRVQDQFENPVSGISVHFNSVNPEAHFLPFASVQTDSAGIAAAKFQLGQTSGIYHITFSIEELPGFILESTAIALRRVPALMRLISGNEQSTPVTQTTPAPLLVQIVDSSGIGVQGIPVLWQIPDSSATLFGRSTFIDTTDMEGFVAAIPRMGSHAGPVNIEVKPHFEYADKFAGVFFQLHATTLAPFTGHRLGDSLLVGSFGKLIAQPLRVQLNDSLGNPVQQAGCEVLFEVTSRNAKFMNNSSSIAVQSDSSGIALAYIQAQKNYFEPAFIQLQIGSHASVEWCLRTAAPSKLMLQHGNNQSAPVNTALDIPPEIIVYDSLGIPAPEVEVLFQITQGGGYFADSSTAKLEKTDSLGSAQCLWVLGDSVGVDTQKLSVSASFENAALKNSPLVFTASARAKQQTVNQPPQVQTPDTLYFVENEQRFYVITAHDPENDTFAFIATGFPKNVITLQGDSLKIYWKPDFTQAGNYSATVRAQDSFKNVSEKTITLHVENTNQPPHINAFWPQSSSVSMPGPGAYTFSIKAEDEDHDKLSFAWYSLSDIDTLFLANTDSLQFFAGEKTPRQIKGVVTDGADSASVVWNIEHNATGMTSDATPTVFYLSRSMPNPFDRAIFPEAKFSIAIPHPARMQLLVCNVLGQRVATIVDKILASGFYSFAWNGKDQFGSQVPQGVYFVILVGDGVKHVQKIAVIN